MEPRTLLVMLQLSGGLGEQSTLDSVVQSENEMYFLNTPKSQNDPHSDGTAIANVTLTTANSSSGNPGVLLDIFSQGSVALHGIANVATSAGLADTDGQIGADVPVTSFPQLRMSSPAIGSLSSSISSTTQRRLRPTMPPPFFHIRSVTPTTGIRPFWCRKTTKPAAMGSRRLGLARAITYRETQRPDRRHIHAFILREPRRPYDRAVPRRRHQ